MPDRIVPLIDSPFPKKEPLYLLAKELATLLECSVALPGPKVQDQKVLLLIDLLHTAEKLIDGKRTLSLHFPEKIFTMALIDHRLL